MSDIAESKQTPATKEFAELLRRAENGQLTPEDFKRCEELLPRIPETMKLPRRRSA